MVKHNIVGDIMFYFLNIMMYLVNIMVLVYYLEKKKNSFSLIMILFNLQLSFFLIYLNYNFLYGILFSIISIILLKFLEIFKKNNNEVILIKDGNVNFHNIVNYYSYFKLLNYLKRHHVHLDEVEYCLMKNNHLVIIKNKEINSFPISLIIDGNIKEYNLKLINKDKKWLQEELLKKHLLIKNVNYAYYRNNQIYYIA